MRYVVGIDIGGTFTDFSVVDDQGRTVLWKEATTPKEPAQGVREGLRNLAEAEGLELGGFLGRIDLFVHGSTIATNTVIQRNGPKTALLCTEGFRDVIYFRDGYKPERYNLNMAPPADFVPRHLRMAVRERIDYKGNALIPLDDSSVVEAARALEREHVKAVAVSLLWSVINPAHERQVKTILERELPGVPVVLSSDVLPAIREWERTCATLLSAYILPGIAQYMQELEDFLRANGLRRHLLFIQLNGGCSTVDKILRKPIYALARAGGGARGRAPLRQARGRVRPNRDRHGRYQLRGLSHHQGRADVEQADAGPRDAGRSRRRRCPFDRRRRRQHRLDRQGRRTAGRPSERGRRPRSGLLWPGRQPPTVTDANLILGYINPDFFLGGRRKIDPDLSRQVIAEQIAKPLDIETAAAAEGIFRIVNNNMVNAIRAVSIERGIDPRGYTLVVGGGAGAIHATTLASDLGIHKILIPRYAGVFCSYGMVVSDVRHDYIKTLACNSESLDLDELNALFAELEAQARAELAEEGFAGSEITLTRFADAKYPNQIHELTVPVPAGHRLHRKDIQEVKESFHALHERMFTYCVRESPVDFFHWSVPARAKPARSRLRSWRAGPNRPPARSRANARSTSEARAASSMLTPTMAAA